MLARRAKDPQRSTPIYVQIRSGNDMTGEIMTSLSQLVELNNARRFKHFLVNHLHAGWGALLFLICIRDFQGFEISLWKYTVFL
jgi:hypothetical protein